jgi:hypothetical protein
LKITDQFFKYKHDFYEIRIYKNNLCTINIKDYEKIKFKKNKKKKKKIKKKKIKIKMKKKKKKKLNTN